MRNQIRNCAAVSVFALSVACGGGGSPTAPSPTAGAPPPQTATLTMTLRASAVQRASALDVQRQEALQTRDLLLEILLGAPSASVEVRTVTCTSALDGVPLAVENPVTLPSAVLIAGGSSHTLRAPMKFTTTSPLPAGPIVFDCSGSGTGLGSPVSAQGQLRVTLAETAAVPSGCGADADTACLLNGRFKTEMTFRDRDGRSGAGKVLELTNDTGYFWFFDNRNVEMIVRVLNGCAVNNRYWVFAGGLTNVEVQVSVTDTQTGTTRKYFNPLNREAREQRDQDAFATCP